MNNSPTQEHATALIEIAKIANHRFKDLVAERQPDPHRPAPAV